jgi:hypothetical protein
MPWGCLVAYLARAKPKTIRDIMPRLPVDLERTVQRAMSRNPADRHASAAKLADELDQFLVRSSGRLRRIHDEGAGSSAKGPHLPGLLPRGQVQRAIS